MTKTIVSDAVPGITEYEIRHSDDFRTITTTKTTPPWSEWVVTFSPAGILESFRCFDVAGERQPELRFVVAAIASAQLYRDLLERGVS